MLNRLLIKFFRAHAAASKAPKNHGARSFNSFVRYAVLGALALSVLPASAESLLLTTAAQNRDAGESGATHPIRVNVTPLREFLARAKRLHEQGKLDLKSPRAITIEADRDEEGLLSNPVITGDSASQPAFRKLAQDFVLAMNNSRALSFMRDVSHVSMSFTLDGQRFSLRSASDTPSATRAEEMARGYRTMINFGRLMKRGTDEGLILNNMKISSSGKQLMMNLDMPRETMGNILLRQITPN